MTQQTAGADASPGQLASEVAKDLSTLVRQEIALAKAELPERTIETVKEDVQWVKTRNS